MNISHYQLDIDTPSIKQSWTLTTALAAQIPPMKTCPCTWAVYTSQITSAILGCQIVEEKVGKLKHLILQTWHLGVQFSLQSANSSSSSLINSQRSSGSRVNSQDKLHQRILQRNNSLQNSSTGLGPNSFAQTCNPILLVNSSDDSDNSPNLSRDHNLNLEQAIQPHLYHSSPSNSMQELPPLHFSGSSNESLENRPPSLNYYGNIM